MARYNLDLKTFPMTKIGMQNARNLHKKRPIVYATHKVLPLFFFVAEMVKTRLNGISYQL